MYLQSRRMYLQWLIPYIDWKLSKKLMAFRRVTFDKPHLQKTLYRKIIQINRIKSINKRFQTRMIMQIEFHLFFFNYVFDA